MSNPCFQMNMFVTKILVSRKLIQQELETLDQFITDKSKSLIMSVSM